MRLYCDNKSAISIAHNPVQHDRTKHIEIDRHFIKEKLESGLICTPYVSTHYQLADVLTKGLCSSVFQSIISKLGMENIYSPAWGGVLEMEVTSCWHHWWHQPASWMMSWELLTSLMTSACVMDDVMGSWWHHCLCHGSWWHHCLCHVNVKISLFNVLGEK